MRSGWSWVLVLHRRPMDSFQMRCAGAGVLLCALAVLRLYCTTFGHVCDVGKLACPSTALHVRFFEPCSSYGRLPRHAAGLESQLALLAFVAGADSRFEVVRAHLGLAMCKL